MKRLLVGLCLLSLWCVEAHAAARHAVLIGTDYQYENQDCQSSADGRCARPLRGPHNDVEALKTVLTGRYGFAADRVTTLIGAEATKQAILETLTGLAATTQPGDLLFIYFSGHGTSGFDQSTSGARPGLHPHPARLSRMTPESMMTTPSARWTACLSVAATSARCLKNSNANTPMVVVFDACFSGNSVRSLGRSRVVIAKYTPLPPLPYTGTPPEPYPYHNLLYIAGLGRDRNRQGSLTRTGAV